MKMTPLKKALGPVLVPALSPVLIALISMVTACKTEDFLIPSESRKAVSGSWEIVKATRNGMDLTERVADKQFRLTFQSDSRGESDGYTVAGDVPFVVSGNGSWAFDDPLYPFAISFHPAGDAAPATIPFLFPVVGGERRISLTFSPGCGNNTYEYVLEKVAE